VDLEGLNRATPAEAITALLACCASDAWAAAMAARRPFADVDQLLTAAADEWWTLGEEDWLQAFAAHPRIGERPEGDDRHATWSRAEQAGANDATDDTRAAIAECNRAYEARFGHGYLVAAAGRDAEQLLELCRTRLENEPDEEFLTAAGEQATITEHRLRLLLGID
jgi:OHCU decarboxylase